MNFIKKTIARILHIETEQKSIVVHTIRDREFTSEELKYISDFLSTNAGQQLCTYLTAQKLAIADRTSSMFAKGDFWQGYANGFKAAIDNFLTLRQPDANGINTSDPSEVGLEELATQLDQSER